MTPLSDSEKTYHFGFDLVRAEELFEMARMHVRTGRGIRRDSGYSPYTLVTACRDDNSTLFLTNMICELPSTLEKAISNSRLVTRTGTGLYRPISLIEVGDVLDRRPKGFKWETPPTYNEMLACAYGKWQERNNAYSALNRFLGPVIE